MDDCQLTDWPWSLVPHWLTPEEGWTVQVLYHRNQHKAGWAWPAEHLDLARKLPARRELDQGATVH